jgi:hypothetical protein
MSFTGATPPNVPNYTKINYAEQYGDLDANGAFTGTSVTPGDRKNPNPPPYFDDGSAGPLHTYATNTAALASGTTTTSGGTENTYPGTGTGVNGVGAVPASTSAAHEGSGTEVRVLAPGNISHTYVVGTLDLSQSVSDGPVMNTQALRDAGYNAVHPSYLSGSAVPTTSAASGASNVSGVGTTLLTVTGTNFNRSSVVYISGIAQTTNYVSATSLTVTNAPKRATAGTLPITVINGVGGTASNSTNWTLT